MDEEIEYGKSKLQMMPHTHIRWLLVCQDADGCPHSCPPPQSRPAICQIKLALAADSGCGGSAVLLFYESSVLAGRVQDLWVELTCLTLRRHPETAAI